MPDATKGGPLAGYRIVEMAGIGPTPLCCSLLADMGADVVRVDRDRPTRFPGQRRGAAWRMTRSTHDRRTQGAA